MTAPRVRLVGALVQLQAFIDDGDNLDPINVQPIQLSTAQLAAIDVDEIVRSLQERIDGDAGPAQAD